MIALTFPSREMSEEEEYAIGTFKAMTFSEALDNWDSFSVIPVVQSVVRNSDSHCEECGSLAVYWGACSIDPDELCWTMCRRCLWALCLHATLGVQWRIELGLVPDNRCGATIPFEKKRSSFVGTLTPNVSDNRRREET